MGFLRVANLFAEVELLELPADFREAACCVLRKIVECFGMGEVIINVSGEMLCIILAAYTAFLLSRGGMCVFTPTLDAFVGLSGVLESYLCVEYTKFYE